ncbi:MAG: hypothetical protein ABJH05_08635 [Fulvivirga sp.]
MKYLKLVSLVVLVIACATKNHDLANFDEATWQADENGCKGDRVSMIQNLQNSKDELKGLNQNEIVAILGKPERHELYKRSQKFFYYQITADDTCDEPADNNIYLSIRFNATGLAKEVIIMNYQN